MTDRTGDQGTGEKNGRTGIYGDYTFGDPEEPGEASGENGLPAPNLFSEEEEDTPQPVRKKRMISRAEFERRLAEKKRRRKKKRIVFLSALCALVLAVVLLAVFGPKAVSSLMRRVGVKTDLQYVPVMSDVQYAGGAGAVVTYGNGCLFVFDGGTVACHGTDGGFLWEYTLKDAALPRILTFRDCVIAYDEEGTVACALGKSGVIWEKRFSGDIDGVFYNEKAGIVAVVYNRDDELYKSTLDVFSVDGSGTVKDLFTKNYTSQYVASAAVSDDGKCLAVSGISAENGDVTGVLSLVSVQSGENYYTKHTEASVHPYLDFVTDSMLAAVGSRELLYVKNATSVESAAQPDQTVSVLECGASERMLCACAPVDGLCIAVFGSGDGVSTASFRDAAGNSVKEVKFENSITGIVSQGKSIVLYSENEIALADSSGRILGKCDSLSGIERVVPIDETHLLVSHGHGVSIVEFTEET